MKNLWDRVCLFLLTGSGLPYASVEHQSHSDEFAAIVAKGWFLSLQTVFSESQRVNKRTLVCKISHYNIESTNQSGNQSTENVPGGCAHEGVN